jgi:hypothetical protein
VPYPKSGPAADHGSSILNPATYEALRNQGKSKSAAAAIANSAVAKGHKKGHHRKGRTSRSR